MNEQRLSVAERLVIGGAVAPALRRRADAPRRVFVVGKDGQTVRVSDDVEVARRVLARADIEFSVTVSGHKIGGAPIAQRVVVPLDDADRSLLRGSADNWRAAVERVAERRAWVRGRLGDRAVVPIGAELAALVWVLRAADMVDANGRLAVPLTASESAALDRLVDARQSEIDYLIPDHFGLVRVSRSTFLSGLLMRAQVPTNTPAR